jgi:hypothetical protein
MQVQIASTSSSQSAAGSVDAVLSARVTPCKNCSSTSTSGPICGSSLPTSMIKWLELYKGFGR